MTSPFSYPVLARDIPAEGRKYEFEANGDERRALAQSLEIADVLSLAANVELRPVRGSAFSVHGTVRAIVVQTDVVTLEPLTQSVEEAIEVTLVPAGRDGPVSRAKEILIDAEEADGPDVFQNGRIDLGMIAAEHLALGLDPYPRAPDAEFRPHIEDNPAPDPSPFAVLAGLRRPGKP